MEGSSFDKVAYLSFALAARTTDYFGKANKNGWLFQQKRKFLLKVIPSAKVLSEIAAVAHSLYHPFKQEKDIESTKTYLRVLLAEGVKRKLDRHATFVWANQLLAAEYNPAGKREKAAWTPRMDALQQYHAYARARTTVRDVLPQTFDKKLIYELIKTAVEAPSSCNKQGWKFLIIDNPKTIEQIASIKRQSFLKPFPYIIACCFDKDAYMGTDAKMTPYLDAGGALLNLTNAATALGLGACWCNFALKNAGAYRHRLFRRAVNLPKNLVPVSFVALGIPGKVLPKPPREDVSFYIHEQSKA